VTVDAYPDEVFPGEITAVAPKSDVEGHSLEVRANLPNEDLKLRPGLFVRVGISLGTNPNAIVIPEQAIWPIGQNKTVYVVVDGKAYQRVVKVGERIPGAVEITEGLKAGDVIVTAGQMKLFEGASVRSAAAAPDQA
ncbi:MAG: efflux RND transporter periplasmic adaptor subunit, partial [Woeseiaceae bacterium]